LANFLDVPSEVREISHDLLLTISDTYLTPSEREFVLLILNKRRTKEIAELLELLPCEVVRRRKIISRKIRVIYIYHYRMNYIEFLKFAANFLTPDKFRCLALYYIELKSLKFIAEVVDIEAFRVLRKLHSCKDTLDRAIANKPVFKIYQNWFSDLRHLNVEVINRSKKDARRLSKIQIGENILSEWLSKDFTAK
jgi:hypothetical protein